MGSCLGWIFVGFFLMIFKLFIFLIKGLWAINLYILQVLSGKPLYYCEPKYLIPGKILGTLGILLIAMGILSLVVLTINSNLSKGKSVSPISVFILLIAGGFLLFASSFLIRRGAI